MSNIPNNVLVDNEDRPMLEAMGKWRMHSQGYACMGKYKDKKYISILMHRVIMNPPPGYQIDHINGDKLDNRRCNLRIVTASENQRNRRNVKGYTYCKRNKKWLAYLFLDGHFKNLGYFKTEEEAKEARQVAKEKYYTIIGYQST